MGVIKRFAVSSIVLGTLALAGGASALAFEGGNEQFPAVQPADELAVSDVPSDAPSDASSDATSDLASDVPSEEPDVLPETGGSDDAWLWISPQGR